MRVLIVDDKKNVLSALVRVIRLKYPDCEFDLTQSGEEAVKLIRQKPFDLIFSDLNIGIVPTKENSDKSKEMSGVEVLEYARQMQEQATRVLVTAYADYPKLEEKQQQGVIEYLLAKPWQREEILAIVERFVKNYKP